MKSKIFLCPHCNTDCPTDDINCPACGRIVRNPPSTVPRQNRSRIGWTMLLLIAAASVIFAGLIFKTVYFDKPETGANSAPVILTGSAN